MKRLIGAVAVGVVVLSLCSPAQGLDMAAKGVKFGFNFAKLSNGGDTDRKFGVAIGGFMAFDLAENLVLQPEILYTMKGGKESGYEAKFNYLECQALVKYSFGAAEVRGYAIGGASLGLQFKDDVSGAGVPSGYDPDGNFIELGLVVGGGAEFPAGPGRMSVDLRFGIGITDVADESYMQAKNRVMTIMAGYAF